ncbi:T9SS type A sorting domain-containing protein [bacterium]|nr:T9SS type A sorting domain-containing protein [bacterium]
MLRSLLIISLFTFSLQTIFAQSGSREIPCYTDEMLERKLAEEPALLQKRDVYEEAVYNNLHMANKNSGSGCDLRIIPTVFHIIHNNGPENISDAAVMEYVKEVNKVYQMRNIKMSDVDPLWQNIVANMQIELRLAQIDPDGKPTTGIVRVQSASTVNAGDNVKSLSMWDPTKYLNIWVVKSITGSTSTSTILGYAYFPWMESRTTSGIVIRSDVANKATLPHELGHYLNLYHPFQDGCGSNCASTGDRVCDTPPTAKDNQGCPMGLNSCSNDNPDVRDMIENMMDYSNCRNMFTLGQKERVDYTLNNTRANLISLSNLYATGVLDSSEILGEPVAAFTSSTKVVCAGSSVDFEDISCTDPQNTEYKWFFPSGSPSAAFTQNPTVTYTNPGIYDVTLIISNKAGSDTLALQKHILVTSEESDVKAPFFESFDSEKFMFDGWSTGGSQLSWEHTNTAKDGDGAVMVNNYGQNVANDIVVLRTPPIDLTTTTVYQLSFDLAYARVNSQGSENLDIYVVDPCKGIEIMRYSSNSNSMRSIDGYVTSEFVPGQSDWKRFTVDISLVKSLKSAAFEFRFTGNGQQDIYMDNLSIGAWPAAVPNTLQSHIEIWPNPASDVLNIAGLDGVRSAIKIYDLSGRVVWNTTVNNAEKFQLPLMNLQNGFYLLEISSENNYFSKKILKN